MGLQYVDTGNWTMLCINRPSANMNKIEFITPSSCQKFKLAPQKWLTDRLTDWLLRNQEVHSITTHLLQIHFDIILPSTSFFPDINSICILDSSICTTCPAHLSRLDLRFLIMLGEEITKIITTKYWFQMHSWTNNYSTTATCFLWFNKLYKHSLHSYLPYVKHSVCNTGNKTF